MNIVKYAYELGYRVSFCGFVVSPYNGLINGGISDYGYKYLSIRINGISNRVMIHRLQAYQLFKDKMFDKGIEVRHLDGNKLNNSVKNIRIGTHKENMNDIPKDERLRKSLHAASFLRKHNKEEIKEFYKKERSYLKTMKNFNISSKGTLHFILNN